MSFLSGICVFWFVSVCMYVCGGMYICIDVLLRLCICMYMYVCVCDYAYVCICIYVCIHARVDEYAHMHIYVYIHICIYIYIYSHAYISQLHIHAHMSHVCIRMNSYTMVDRAAPMLIAGLSRNTDP